MRKHALALIAATPGMLLAQEEEEKIEVPMTLLKPYHHTLQPKIFYRHHKEGKDKYSLSGFGLQYQFDPGVGFTYKLCSVTNFSKGKPFFHGSTTFGWKFDPIGDWQLFSNIQSDIITHAMRVENEDHFLNAYKTQLFLGVGVQYAKWSVFQPYVEIGPMKDTSNSLVAHHEDHFSGRNYYNPWAGKVRLGVECKMENGNSFFIESFYAHSEKHCYLTCGLEISVKWSF